MTLVSAPALADCVPGTELCASIGAGLTPAVQVGGQISIGIPPIVVPVPAPAPAAPPPVVVYPAYPAYPAYGYAPPQQPMYYYAPPPQPSYPASRLALDLRLDGSAGFGHGLYHNAYGLGGGGLGLRYRVAPHFGLEAGVDLLGGRDYNDDRRFEVAGTGGGLVYFNPRSRAQVYLSGGFLGDYARADVSPLLVRQYEHVGGYAGLGLEIFLGRRVALHFDARGLVRQNVAGDAAQHPEFTDPSTGRSTNTSGGVVGSAGLLLYF